MQELLQNVWANLAFIGIIEFVLFVSGVITVVMYILLCSK